jgi:hypothetical protein
LGALLLAVIAIGIAIGLIPGAKVPANSVGSAQIKSGSITSADLSRGVIGSGGGITGPAGKVGATGATGLPGAVGPRGPAGTSTSSGGGFSHVTDVSQSLANVSGTQSEQVNCTGTLKVISGGATINGDGVVLTTSTVSKNGWTATATPLPSVTTASPKYTLTVTAICAS